MTLITFLLASSFALSHLDEQRAAPVEKVSCKKFGFFIAASGTAFRVKDRIVSAAHVWDRGKCRPAGLIENSTRIDRPNDYVEVGNADHSKPRYEVSCEPFSRHQYYIAIGHPNGQARSVAMKMQITGLQITKEAFPTFGAFSFNSWQMVGANGKDQFQPGMSGGPILNHAGKVVGIIIGQDNKGVSSFARSVLDTPLCKTTLSSIHQ